MYKLLSVHWLHTPVALPRSQGDLERKDSVAFGVRVCLNYDSTTYWVFSLLDCFFICKMGIIVSAED